MITREEFIDWLKSPATQGLYEIFKQERLKAEDEAFTASLAAFKKESFLNRSVDEVLCFARLEVANYLLLSTFHPLYENLKELAETKSDPEAEKGDYIQTFINKLQEAVNSNEKKV